MAAKRHEQDLAATGVDTEQASEAEEADRPVVPRPTPHFRRRAWIAFQRALDPLSSPRPLPPPRA